MKSGAFVVAMKALQDQMQLDRQNGRLITRLGDPEMNNHTFVFTTPMIEQIMTALQIEFDDKAGWISYFVYETDFGRKADEFYITKADKSTVKFYDAGALYKWLVSGEA